MVCCVSDTLKDTMRAVIFVALVAVGTCLPQQKSLVFMGEGSSLPQSDEQCTTCVQVAQAVTGALRSKDLRARIVSLINNDICTLYPEEFAQECYRVVTEFLPKILFVAASTNPRMFCSIIQLCDGQELQSTPDTPVLEDALLTLQTAGGVAEAQHAHCDACMLFAKLAVTFITSNATEKEVSKLFSPACQSLPSPLQQECRVLLAEHESAIVNMIVKKVINPDHICHFLDFCPADSLVN